METTAISHEFPAVTEMVTNGVEVFFYDVTQYNGNASKFFDSIAKYANNIIIAIKSTQKYFAWIHDVADALYNSGYLPDVFGVCISISLFFLLLNFIRGK